MNFVSIKDAARLTGLSETGLRRMVHTGKCPGVYSGTWFRVNLDKLVAMLENETSANGPGSASRAESGAGQGV